MVLGRLPTFHKISSNWQSNSASKDQYSQTDPAVWHERQEESLPVLMFPRIRYVHRMRQLFQEGVIDERTPFRRDEGWGNAGERGREVFRILSYFVTGLPFMKSVQNWEWVKNSKTLPICKQTERGKLCGEGRGGLDISKLCGSWMSWMDWISYHMSHLFSVNIFIKPFHSPLTGSIFPNCPSSGMTME